MFKLLTHGDERAIETETKARSKASISNSITLRLKHQIVEVNGDRDKAFIRSFVDNGLLANDSIALRKYIRSITPGVDFTFTFVGSDGYVEEGVSLPLGLSFFYPEL